jgi:hypothetical protein
MRIPHIIIGAALMAAFAFGCSKDATPIPSVTFTGYKTGKDGIKRASFELANPSKEFTAVCHLQLEPGDVDEGMTSIPAGGYSTTEILIRQASVTALKVTVMRLSPVRQFSVSLP